MELKVVWLKLSILIIVSVAQENSTYNAVELLSKIFPFGDNEFEKLHISPKYLGEPTLSPDATLDGFADIYQGPASRNNVNRKKRRRQRYPDGFGNPYPYPDPGYEGNFYERPTFASEALSRLTEALTSIALYDDYQCVPRLLCEGGGGALGGSSVLPTGLQPLLTLLSAYGGTSSNPLFIFGRAVLLGMSSKDSPGSCRYAYPQCPTDPEQLVYYLNNHNGGFFRFFNAPQKGQQNLQQFYNHLQNYQYAQENGQQHQNNLQNQQFGQQNQNFDLYEQQNHGGYGLQKDPYLNYGNNYGFAFPYNHINEHFKIEKRIQNKPNSIDDEELIKNNNNVKWSFPDTTVNGEPTAFNIAKDKILGKAVKFPETNTNYIIKEYNRKTRGFVFPNNVNYYTNYQKVIDDNFENNNKVNNPFNHNNLNFNNVDDGYVTVYVVRGNGDPNRPEIVKLRPGESL